MIMFLTGSLGTPVRAQSGRTGTVRGRVLDTVGASIPGATVTLRDPKGAERTTFSVEDGGFVLRDIGPGTQTLTVMAQGFKSHQQVLSVKAGVTEVKDIKLPVAIVESTVEVQADRFVPTTDPAENMGAIVLDEAFLATLPDDREELLTMLQELAGPAANATGEGPELYIDGFNGGRLPPKSDIQRIRINSNPMSAEFSRPGHSRIEITTKPGRDQFGGGFVLGFNDSALNARNTFSPIRPPYQRRRFESYMHGPILEKRASFSTHFDYNNAQDTETVVATVLSGGQIVPFSAAVIHPNRDVDFGLRTDWLLWGDKTLNLKFNISDDRSDNQGVGNFTLPERAVNVNTRRYSVQAGNIWIFSSRVLNEARLQLRRYNTGQQALTSGYAINVTDAFQAGGNPQGQSHAATYGAEFHDSVSISYKRHSLRIGGRVELEHRNNFRQTNYNGTFIFSSIEQYRQALADEPPFDPAPRFTITRGDPFLGFSTMEYAWFINDDIQVRPNLTLSAGLRHELQAWLPDRKNFAPRFGLAWSPKTARRTVIRTGAGLFYNRLGPGLIENVLRQQRMHQEQTIIFGTPTDNIFPNPFILPATTGNRIPTERRFAPGLQAPYSMQWSASIEHLLPHSIVASVNFLHSRGQHLFRLRNVNAPWPGAGDRPDPLRGNVLVTESVGRSSFNMLAVQVQRRLSRFANFVANYSMSFSRDDVGGLPANNYDLSNEWGPSAADQRHRLFLTGTLYLPWGMRMHSIFQYASPMPFNITTGVDNNRDASYTTRPGSIHRNSDLPASLYPTIPTSQKIVFSRRQASFVPDRLRAQFDTDPFSSSFAVPTRLYLETLYPDGVRARGPNSVNVNLRLSKTIGFGAVPNSGRDNGGGGSKPKASGERMGGWGKMRGERRPEYSHSVTFSVGAYNLLNRVNYGQYIGTLTSPYFGRANSARSARRIDMQLSFNF